MSEFEEVELQDVFGDFDEDEYSEKIGQDVDTEQIVKAIRRCDEEIAFLKKLKANRVRPIDEKIEKLSRNQDKLKYFALDLMDKYFPNKNTVDFPGIAKITKRKKKGKWEIVDEDALVGFLKESGCESAIKTKESIDKKELPKVLANILKDKSEDDIVGAEFVEPERDVSLVVKVHKEEQLSEF
jgi:phage host-nuclease inhibitor protein Gam